MKNKIFNPLMFLMALGAGGISVIPFSFLQYTFHKGAGLINYSMINHAALSFGNSVLFRSMEAVMIIFSLIHLLLTFVLVKKLIKYRKTDDYKKLLNNPLKNSALMAFFISIVMTMNVFIGPIRYFIPAFANNLQSFMLPALITWLIIWYFLMKKEIQLLKISFSKNFDVSKISFGWLLHPFALAMLTVTGTGIAAMSHSANVSHIAAFFSIVSGSMAGFLLVVKLISIFKSHFAQDGLPEKQFLPSFLIVIPNITLLAIAAFRLGHYAHHYFGVELGIYNLLVVVTAFAFETWYMMFGLSMLWDYFKKEFFKKEFYVSQWGLVCPFVAYAVLGSFAYKIFVANAILYAVIILTTIIVISLFFVLLVKQIKCSANSKKNKIQCL